MVETDDAAFDALSRVDALLVRGGGETGDDYVPRSLESALQILPAARWALVSTPGRFAAGVARDALDRGLNVFLYSDNVAVEDEVELKRKATAEGLLVMGPDCGTALVGGIGFGFANRVRRGSIGLVRLPGLPSLHLGSWHFDIGSSVTASYYLVYIYVLVLLCIVGFVFRSNLGLALRAVREEEIAAEAVGIRTNSLRLFSLLLSAFFTGVSGACYAHLVRYIGPGLVYGIHFSAIPMIFAICGGRFTIIGPALAALILYPVDQFIFHPLLPSGHEFLYGVVLIMTVLFMPAGFWGSLRKVS